MSQWGTQPMRPELVDKGMTAYLWMLAPTGKQGYCTVIDHTFGLLMAHANSYNEPAARGCCEVCNEGPFAKAKASRRDSVLMG